MLIPSNEIVKFSNQSSLSRRVNANSQRGRQLKVIKSKLIKKGEC